MRTPYIITNRLRFKSVSILTIVVLLISVACTKFKSKITNETSDGLQSLVVSDDFLWTSGLQGSLNISFENPNNVSLEKEVINIINETGTVIKRTQITDRVANFKIDLPQNAQYRVHYPVTSDTYPIESLGEITVTLGQTLVPGAQLKSVSVLSCTSCASPLKNAGAEEPTIPTTTWKLHNEADVLGWETTADDNKIEIWSTGFKGVPAQEGVQFFEINANKTAALYQELCIEPGSTITWSVWHRGRSGVDVAVAKIGASVENADIQALMSDGKEWGYYEGTYTVPVNQTTTVFAFEAVSTASGNASIGNFLDNFEIQCDRDGDGVKDDQDDAPNNPNVAYISYFPTSGKQIVAFEDLWPSLGDFDFNDLTMSNKVTIYKNADFKPISASFTVSIDVIGATIHNGIGLMLYDENKEPITENIISSVSDNVTLDDGNVNGIILTNDVFETIGNPLYHNNGYGRSAVPDTLQFTVTFNENAFDFIPELYLFQTSNRSHEIHRSDFPSTKQMDNNLFGTKDDAKHYKTANGLPWGIEIYLEGAYASPIEFINLLNAYPDFGSWISSDRTAFTNWYENPDESKVFVVPTE